MFLYSQAAQLAEDILGEAERSVAAWREVLDVNPAHSGASEALERIHRAAKNGPSSPSLCRSDTARGRSCSSICAPHDSRKVVF